jgi:adenylate cyclase
MDIRRRYREFTCTLCALTAVVVAFLVGGRLLSDGLLLDLLIKVREVAFSVEDRPEQSPVVVVALDRRSLETPELVRYPRVLMGPIWAAIMDDVFEAGALAVGFDLLFSYSANQFSPNFDAPFLAALDKHRERLVLARTGATLPALPFLAALRNDGGALGGAEILSDPDGRYRHVRARYEAFGGGTFAGLASALLIRAKAPPLPDELLLAPRRHLERIPAYAVVDVLRCAKQAPDVLARAFAGKIVLVGGTLAEEDRKVSSGQFLTPSRVDSRLLHPCGLRRLGASDQHATSVPGVFLHAAAIEAVVSGRVTSTAPTPVVAGLAAVTAAGGALLGLVLAPWLVVRALVLIGVALFGAGTVALAGDLWVPLALPLAMLMIASALAYAVRYLVEERARRRIQHAFSHYLSPVVVDRLAEESSSLKLGGERSEVTVMFADLSGFTALSGKVEPEVLTRLTNQYLGYIVEEVDATRGYVDKFMGDAVLGIWGAPASDSGHAVNGIRAALAAATRIRREHGAATARGETGFSVKIGLNSGPAVVGNVGTVRRYNYTAVGETVNVASRLESVPTLFGCQVVIGPLTAELARDEFLMRELDWILVKGAQAPFAVFEPLVERAKATPEEIDRVRRFADALAHFRAMRFVEAYTIWDALAREEQEASGAFGGKSERPPGPPAKMAERARAFAAHPPPVPWDGVWVLTSK